MGSSLRMHTRGRTERGAVKEASWKWNGYRAPMFADSICLAASIIVRTVPSQQVATPVCTEELEAGLLIGQMGAVLNSFSRKPINRRAFREAFAVFRAPTKMWIFAAWSSFHPS